MNLCLLKNISKVNKNPSILSYGKLQEINNSKYFKRPFRISMGFGLHLGWGIEGPIGSQFKMDCSYISPNVCIASSLEKITQQYGVDILISDSLYNNLSQPLKELCRKIDIIKLNRLDNEIELYTIDVILDYIKPGKFKKPIKMF